MAEPITNIKKKQLSEEEIQEQDIQEINQKLSENKEAVMNGIEILGTLHEHGFLDMADAMVKQRKAIMENIFGELSEDQYAGMLENLSQAVFLLGDIDVQGLKQLTGRVNEGLEEANEASESEKTSAFSLMKSLKEPEINRSLTILLQFLRGMGKKEL